MGLYHTPLKFLPMGFNGKAIRCTHSCKNPHTRTHTRTHTHTHAHTRTHTHTTTTHTPSLSQLVESEIVADNCKSRCAEQQIPFYRFSPQLDEVVASGEIDNDKLVEMIIQAKVQTKEQGLDDLVKMFKMIAEAKVKTKYRETKKGIVANRYSSLEEDSSQ